MALTKITRSLLSTGVSDSSDATAITIDSSERVGIGTASPTEKLTINGALAITGALSDDRTSTGAMDFSSGVTRFISYGASSTDGIFAFRTAQGGASSTERMRINGSGNIGFNTSDVTVGSSVSGNSTATPKFITYNNDYSSGYTDASLKLYLFNQGTTRQGFTSGPAFDLQYHTSGSDNGRHAFYVANTETMRINKSQVLIGTTSALQSDNTVSISGSATGAGSGVVDIRNTSSNDNCGVISLSKTTATTTSANRYIYFYASNFGANMGAIGANGTGNAAFVATSDERLKENIKPITGSLNKVLALNPVSFDWKKNGEHIKAGFVAQEVEKVLPEYTDTEEDEMKTKTLTGGMTGGYIAVLTKAIQELSAEVEELKTKLENK